MNLKHIVISASVVAIGFVSIYATRKGKEKDALDKRIFNTAMIEVREGQGNKKSVPDEIEFKGGKVFSTYLFDKLEYKWLKYEITKDSTFTDEEANESHWIEVTATHTDDADQTIEMNMKVENYDIEGTVKITKKDKLKKKFEFTGKEKPKKK